MLRALLTLFIAINGFVAVRLLLRLLGGEYGGIRAANEAVGFLIVACLLNVTALTAVWAGRRWGVVLLFCVAVVVGVVNLRSGFSVVKAVAGLAPPILVYLLARPTFRRKRRARIT